MGGSAIVDDGDRSPVDHADADPALWIRVVNVAVGGVVIAVCVTAIVGWHTHSVRLVQIRSSYAPMQQNTAVGLICCATALVGLTFRRNRVVAISATLGSGLAIASLIEYVFSIDLGLDTAFVEPFATTAVSAPGRMSPITALALLMFTGGSAASVIDPNASRRSSTLSMTGAFVLVPALLELVHYATGSPSTAQWANFSHMAVHTATAFCLVAGGVVLLALGPPGHAGLESWVPAAVGASMLGVTVIVWEFLVRTGIDDTVSADRAASAMLVAGMAMAALVALATIFAMSAVRRRRFAELTLVRLEAETAERRRVGAATRAEERERAQAQLDRLAAESEQERLRVEAERQRVESRLRQSQHLESLGQLAGGIAHDFNNLLGVIQTSADLTARQIDRRETADEEQWALARADVARIDEAAKQGGRLTHQLLAFARREPTRPTIVDLGSVISEVEQLLARTLGRHVRFTTMIDPHLDPVLVDRTQMEQMLVNLAVNARDAMPEGGKLVVEASNFDVDGDFADARPELSAGPHVRLRVSDTGVGMSPTELERMFDPFYTTKSTGTGLGLATVYGIVTQAGGRIQAYSEVGHGTTITVLLPSAERAGTDERTATTSDLPPIADRTILVIEDNVGLLRATERILADAGYEVLAAGDGTAALTTAERYDGEIHLLLTDVMMPDMLGNELARRIAKLRPDIRVVYMSGYAEAILDAGSRLSPGDTLVDKPFTSRQILAAVNTALS